MRKINNTFNTIIIIFIILSGCKKTEIEQINLNGSIHGKVYCVSESSGSLGVLKSGINVQLENTELYGVTDGKGEFTINSIPSGTYNIVYSKDQYSTTKQCGVQIIGGSDYPIEVSKVFIYETSTTEATNLTVQYSNEDITFSAEISPEAVDTLRRGIVLIISDNGNVAFDNNLDFYWETINN